MLILIAQVFVKYIMLPYRLMSRGLGTGDVHAPHSAHHMQSSQRWGNNKGLGSTLNSKHPKPYCDRSTPR